MVVDVILFLKKDKSLYSESILISRVRVKKSSFWGRKRYFLYFYRGDLGWLFFGFFGVLFFLVL